MRKLKSYRQIFQDSLPDEFICLQITKELGDRGQCKSCMAMIRGTCPDKEEQEYTNLPKRGHFCWKPDPEYFKQRCDAYEQEVRSGIDRPLLDRFVSRHMREFDKEHRGYHMRYYYEEDQG